MISPPQSAGQSTRALARARSTVQQALIDATPDDLTAMIVTFTTTTRDAEVTVDLPYIFGTLEGGILHLAITDENGVVKAETYWTAPGANASAGSHLSELIEAPGTYTRKVQLDCIVAGTGGCGANLPNIVAQLKVTEQSSSVLDQTHSLLTAGRFTAAQLDATHLPRIPQALPPVLYLHGAGATASELLGVTVPSVRLLMRQFAIAGYPVGCATMTATWGNATTDSRIADALTWMRANTEATDDPPILVGSSHGVTCALDYAADHAVSCVVGIIGAIDLQAIRVADTLGLRASIDTAHGVVYPAALPVGSNPATLTAPLASVPQQLWYSTDDAVAANTATYAAAVGAELHSLGALGHTDAAIAAVDAAQVLAFVAANI